MRRRRMTLRTAILTIAVGLLSIGITLAQTDTCPALVEQAMATANTACGAPGRNTACYGNTLVSAAGWDETPLAFNQPGDKVNLAEIAALSTAPLDTESATWGVALLSLQANLPDTVPGQNVYFVVFGGVELESAAAPASEESITLPAQVLSATDARRGPSASQESLGTLAAGTTITVNGRNANGDWLQFVQGDSGVAWVYAPLVQITGDGRTLTALPTMQGTALTAPMQAFRISTGIGIPLCQEAPRDGVLIQAPEDTTVYFNVNGVDVSIGSTAYLHNVTEDILRITNLEGDVDVSSAGITRELEPGEQVDIVPQAPLPDPIPYDVTNAQSLPLQLLPEEISLPQPAQPTVTPTFQPQALPATAQVAPQFVFTAFCEGTTAYLRVENVGAATTEVVTVDYFVDGAALGQGVWDFGVSASHTFSQEDASQSTIGLRFPPTNEYREITCPSTGERTPEPPRPTEDPDVSISLDAYCDGTTAYFRVELLSGDLPNGIEYIKYVDGIVTFSGGAFTPADVPHTSIIPDADRGLHGLYIVATGQYAEISCAVQTPEPPATEVGGEPQWSFTAYCTGTEASLRVELIGGTPPGRVPVTYYMNGAPWGGGSASWDFPFVGAANTFGPADASSDTWGLLFNPTGEYQEIGCPLPAAP